MTPDQIREMHDAEMQGNPPMTDTPIDRKSVERLAGELENRRAIMRPTVEMGRLGAKTLRALLAAKEKAEAERDALREELQ